jgi:hypothetical protein
MNTTAFRIQTIGRMAISTGVIGISTLIFGFIFAFGGDIVGDSVSIFYRLNDLFNLIMALMSGAFAWMLYSHFQEKMTSLHGGLLILILAGMVLAVIGFWMIAFGRTGWILSGWYTDTAYALIGLWVISFNYSALQNDLLPKGISSYGILVGAVMALGFASLPGLLRNIDSTDFMSPLLYGMWTASIRGWILLYPIWCIILGRHFLKQN